MSELESGLQQPEIVFINYLPTISLETEVRVQLSNVVVYTSKYWQLPSLLPEFFSSQVKLVYLYFGWHDNLLCLDLARLALAAGNHDRKVVLLVDETNEENLDLLKVSGLQLDQRLEVQLFPWEEGYKASVLALSRHLPSDLDVCQMARIWAG